MTSSRIYGVCSNQREHNLQNISNNKSTCVLARRRATLTDIHPAGG